MGTTNKEEERFAPPGEKPEAPVSEGVAGEGSSGDTMRETKSVRWEERTSSETPPKNGRPRINTEEMSREDRERLRKEADKRVDWGKWLKRAGALVILGLLGWLAFVDWTWAVVLILGIVLALVIASAISEKVWWLLALGLLALGLLALWKAPRDWWPKSASWWPGNAAVAVPPPQRAMSSVEVQDWTPACTPLDGESTCYKSGTIGRTSGDTIFVTEGVHGEDTACVRLPTPVNGHSIGCVTVIHRGR